MVSNSDYQLNPRKHGFDCKKADFKKISEQIEKSIKMVDSDSKLQHYFSNLRLMGNLRFD